MALGCEPRVKPEDCMHFLEVRKIFAVACLNFIRAVECRRVLRHSAEWGLKTPPES